jgi:hypothetical protein
MLHVACYLPEASTRLEVEDCEEHTAMSLTGLIPLDKLFTKFATH